MAGDESKPGSPKHLSAAPAVIVGGQRRRRLVRRSTLERSMSSPALNLEPGPDDSRTNSEATTDSTVATESTARVHGRRPTPLTLKSLEPSESDESEDNRDMKHSPLPPSTPSKAAQFLGIDSYDIENSRKEWQKTKVEDESTNAKAKEDGDDAGSTASSSKTHGFKRLHLGKKLGKGETPEKKEKQPRKGMHLSNLMPSFGSSPKHFSRQGSPYSLSQKTLSEEDIEEEHGDSDGEVQVPMTSDASFHLPAPQMFSLPQRKIPVRGSKRVVKMKPILEVASSDDGTWIQGEDVSVTEQVLKEYEMVETTPENDLALINHSKRQYTVAMGNVRDGVNIDLRNPKWQHTPAIQTRSPLQVLENGLLDVEEGLEAMKLSIDQSESERKRMDAAVSQMRMKHEYDAGEFEIFKIRMVTNIEKDRFLFTDPDETARASLGDAVEDEDTGNIETESEDDSIRSSIDLDEEPTLHTAKAVTFTKIPPGSVKIVDIPPRKIKANSQPVVLNPSDSGIDHTPSSGIYENLWYDGPHEPGEGTSKRKKQRPDASRTTDWINSYEFNDIQQRPRSNGFDIDVRADRRIPPAPLPKDPHLVSPLPHRHRLAPPSTHGNRRLSPLPNTGNRRTSPASPSSRGYPSPSDSHRAYPEG